MFQKPILLLTLLGITLGLFVGVFDSFFHFVNVDYHKGLNLLVLLLFFTGVYRSVTYLRDRIKFGFITYGNAARNIIYVGTIASIVIAAIRFAFLRFMFNLNIDTILNHTKQSMIERYGLYTDEQLYNRLSFIEFTYHPVVSTILYFVYYSIFVIIFAFLASFFIKRVNRTIST